MNRKLVTLLAAFHLIVMVTGTFPSVARTAVEKFLVVYSRLTESGSNFGFFSPNVANQLVVTFKVKDRDQSVHSLKIDDLGTEEASIRLKNMVRFFTQVYSNPRARRSVAASLAKVVFDREPKADEITFEASFFYLPGLNQFAEQKLKTEPVYRVTFTRS